MKGIPRKLSDLIPISELAPLAPTIAAEAVAATMAATMAVAMAVAMDQKDLAVRENLRTPLVTPTN
jgi:hypothetical protein